uniref:Uncharacterized protein n=1 Tax=Ananas comosus var. bracteatus TaxID=296719 RepID=A0A6V7NTE7_ANACO|nr:unnamed protein product [Ananas comosus var. bracteatus]
MKTVLDWIKTQSAAPSAIPVEKSGQLAGTPPPKARDTSGVRDDDDSDDDGSIAPSIAEGRSKSFKVEAKIEIPNYDGVVDAEKLDAWLDQLETYFNLYNYSNAKKCEQLPTAHAMWIHLKEKFGGTTVIKLRQLTIKFDTYKKRPNHTIKQHLREMSNMIKELKSAGHILTDEQQVPAVIRSLPESWEHMKVNLTHNDSIKTFAHVARHVELEDERLAATRGPVHANMTESSSHKALGSGYKKFKSRKRKRVETGQGPKKNKFKENQKCKRF